MKILSFDISSISTGYCLIVDGRLNKNTCGTIKPNPKEPYGARLGFFEQEVSRIIALYNPDEISIEDIYFSRNIKTYKVLSYFRAVAIKVIYSVIGRDPISITASEVRGLLEIPNNKEEAFRWIMSRYKLDFTFEEHNDITDAIALGLATHLMKKQGINEKSLRSVKRRPKRKRRRNKKSVS